MISLKNSRVSNVIFFISDINLLIQYISSSTNAKFSNLCYNNVCLVSVGFEKFWGHTKTKTRQYRAWDIRQKLTVTFYLDDMKIFSTFVSQILYQLKVTKKLCHFKINVQPRQSWRMHLLRQQEQRVWYVFPVPRAEYHLHYKKRGLRRAGYL